MCVFVKVTKNRTKNVVVVVQNKTKKKELEIEDYVIPSVFFLSYKSRRRRRLYSFPYRDAIKAYTQMHTILSSRTWFISFL